MTITLKSLALDRWVEAASGFVDIPSAVDGRVVARASSAGLDFAAMVRHARKVGGAGLRDLSFHRRADRLRALAGYVSERKEALYQLAGDTGANRRDNMIDIDGGLATLSAYASRGRRDLPDAKFVVEGDVENLSKAGSFVGRHILSPLHGVAVHINAFNFPCWGLLEKLAPALLAGVPVIAKPATATAYVTEALVRLIHESGILPPGSLQLICGSTGDLLDQLGGQDVISFTGSIETSERLRRHPNIAKHSIRFVAERDSLNAAVLGSDVTPADPEFDLFVREVIREMTVKAGQKCTAIRRVLVPRAQQAAVTAALQAGLAQIQLGDPRNEDRAMGPLVSLAQREAVRAQIATLQTEAEIVFGNPDACAGEGIDLVNGAFLDSRCCVPSIPWRRGAFTIPRHSVRWPRSWPMMISMLRSNWCGTARAAWWRRCSRIMPRSRRPWCSGLRPGMAASWWWTATAPRNPPATARRCRAWCMAVPAAPAAARSLAACAPCFTTCSAPRCRDRRRGWRR